MSPSVHGIKESTWFWGFGTSAAALAGKVQYHVDAQDLYGCAYLEKAGAMQDEDGQPCNFDFAELLEKGLGPGLASCHAKPPSEFVEQQHLRIHRSQDRSEYRLTTEEGRSLLVAKCNADGTHIDLFMEYDSQAAHEVGPAFTLKSNPGHEHWLLHAVRCERCQSRGKRQCGSRELARMSHYCEPVGEGEAFCLDLTIPEVGEDGSFGVVCPVCSDSSEQMSMIEFTSRRPKWNPRHRTLTMDFGQRCTVASAKNFQLELRAKPSKVKLLFGKVGPHEFVLDYKYPLSAVQAFAAALTASHWK